MIETMEREKGLEPLTSSLITRDQSRSDLPVSGILLVEPFQFPHAFVASAFLKEVTRRSNS